MARPWLPFPFPLYFDNEVFKIANWIDNNAVFRMRLTLCGGNKAPCTM